MLCFSTGNIYRWEKSNNRADLIKHARKLDVDGIELTFIDPDSLKQFIIKDEDKDWLKSLKRVSIHAPSRWERSSMSQKNIIKEIKRIYDLTYACNVIIHPYDLPDPKLLKDCGFNISIENMAPIANFDNTKLIKILDDNPTYNLCLDIAHTFLYSKDETKNLINLHKNRISQVHFSGVIEGQDHELVSKSNNDFFKSVKPLKGLNVPIVIEMDFKEKDIDKLKKEVEFIRKLVFDD